MSNDTAMTISELSDADLDAVAAGSHHGSGQYARDNFALQFASNRQTNLALGSDNAGQGGNQTNSNNAGNIST